ncbi:MAG: TrmH family RNA methyltransferase [Patescibacteria group bacterium]|nr:TrmH family RNA methyltransferase [Patescibacteria group bacterium]MCL5261884.1 TrmH family RNA methyltransferase [Patescibacteria group bacterium]
MIVVLHNVRSLHNVGSIFRTADAAGFSKIYLCGITPEPVDRFGRIRPQMSKVALGAEKYLEWEKAKSTGRLLNRLSKDGYKVVSLEQDGRSIPFDKIKFSRKDKIALVVGNEVRGLPKSVLEKSDKIIEIPMAGKKESLNVAVAFGIAAFSLRK